ncbi:MAG TPA: MarR family transcriptional regulator [Bacteroidales bacterium]|nr:MarR family transcriptional regulator [Bacteroidales bacterium]
METQEKILKTLETAGKPMRPGEIAEASGLEKKDVEKEIKKLKTAGKIFSPKMCFYDIQK